ncbi:hypothetical protein A7982_13033 [Minicystis rosea]|nr:hypothetical protein A7982_13033 [Minicystis rosea]
MIDTGTGGGGAASTGAATSDGGADSVVTSSGSGGTGGVTVPACKAGVAGECDAGEYCDAATSACHSCADLSSLRFHGQAFTIDVAPSTASTTAFYPRVSAAEDGKLYFTYVDRTDAIPRRRIVSAPRKTGTPGWQWGTWLWVLPPVGSAGQDSGPLLLDSGAMLTGLVDPSKLAADKPVILFDSNRNGTTTQKLFAANLDGTVAADVSLPSGKRDSDVAAAPNASPPRYYWLSDAGSSTLSQRLVTATATSQATEVKLTLDNNCVTSVVEGPWVTPNGKLLLFAAAYPEDGTCALVGGTKHLFITRMTDQGTQAPGEKAQPLFPDSPTTFDSTPALTPDMCMLLFARFDDTANGRLFGALRE